jgi:hypothetical protein
VTGYASGIPGAVSVDSLLEELVVPPDSPDAIPAGETHLRCPNCLSMFRASANAIARWEEQAGRPLSLTCPKCRATLLYRGEHRTDAPLVRAEPTRAGPVPRVDPGEEPTNGPEVSGS